MANRRANRRDSLAGTSSFNGNLSLYTGEKWIERWFEINGSNLAYYKSKTQHSLLAAIPLVSINSVEYVSVATRALQEKDKSFFEVAEDYLKKEGLIRGGRFKIGKKIPKKGVSSDDAIEILEEGTILLDLASRSFHLRAATKEIAMDWIKALRKSIEISKTNYGPPKRGSIVLMPVKSTPQEALNSQNDSNEAGGWFDSLGSVGIVDTSSSSNISNSNVGTFKTVTFMTENGIEVIRDEEGYTIKKSNSVCGINYEDNSSCVCS